MEVIIHKKVDSFNKIFPEWRLLKEEFHETTIFQDINWIKSWWNYKSSQDDITPYIIEVRKGDKTIGIVPLYTTITNYMGMGFRVLKPMGSENSDYLLPIISKDYSPNTILSLAFDKIYKDKINWDYIEWGDIPEDSLFANFLNSFLEKRSTLIKRNRGSNCPILKLNGSIEDVELKLSKSLLKEIIKKEKRINKEGEFKYSKVIIEQEIEPILNKFFEFHCERWENTDTPSVYRFKEERDYVIEFAINLHKNNLLYLAYLSCDNDIVGIDFGMSDGKKRYLYLHAINNKYRKYSPGNILTYRLIIEAHKEGHENVDFLRGDEDYKRKWGTLDKFNYKYIIFNRKVKSSLLRIGYDITTSNYQFKRLAKQFLA